MVKAKPKRHSHNELSGKSKLRPLHKTRQIDAKFSIRRRSLRQLVALLGIASAQSINDEPCPFAGKKRNRGRPLQVPALRQPARGQRGSRRDDPKLPTVRTADACSNSAGKHELDSAARADGSAAQIERKRIATHRSDRLHQPTKYSAPSLETALANVERAQDRVGRRATQARVAGNIGVPPMNYRNIGWKPTANVTTVWRCGNITIFFALSWRKE